MNRMNGNGDDNPKKKTEDGKRIGPEAKSRLDADLPKQAKPKRVPKPGARFDVDGAARYLLNERLEEVITKGPKWWIWNNRIWEPIDPLTVPAREAYAILNPDNKSAKNAKAVIDAVNLIRQKTDEEVKFRNSNFTIQRNLKVNLNNQTLKLSL